GFRRRPGGGWPGVRGRFAIARPRSASRAGPDRRSDRLAARLGDRAAQIPRGPVQPAAGDHLLAARQPVVDLFQGPRGRRAPRRRYALPHDRADRGAARRAHRTHRHAFLPVAVRARATELVVLKIESLAFGFPGRTVGRDVSFSLGAGEAMCVLGPNGGGKTTL